MCERNTVWFLKTFLQHFENNCFLDHRYTHKHNQPHLKPPPPSTLLSIKLTLSLWQLAALSGRCAGQRVMWHLQEFWSLRQPSYSPSPTRAQPSPVHYCFHTFFSHYFFLSFTSEWHVFFSKYLFIGEMYNCCASSIKLDFILFIYFNRENYVLKA